MAMVHHVVAVCNTSMFMVALFPGVTMEILRLSRIAAIAMLPATANFMSTTGKLHELAPRGHFLCAARGHVENCKERTVMFGWCVGHRNENPVDEARGRRRAEHIMTLSTALFLVASGS
jgi:hypothetical protein